MFWVRVPHEESGFRATVTDDSVALAPSATVTCDGYDEPSKYVVRSPSVTLDGTKMEVLAVPVTGLPRARLVVDPPVPLRVTVLLACDVLPAASLATT